MTGLGAREGCGEGDGDRDESSLSSSSLRALVSLEEQAKAELRSTRTGDGNCAGVKERRKRTCGPARMVVIWNSRCDV